MTLVLGSVNIHDLIIHLLGHNYEKVINFVHYLASWIHIGTEHRHGAFTVLLGIITLVVTNRIW